jgi:hypothetical protein
VVFLQLTISGSGAGPTLWTWDRKDVGELPRRVLQVSDSGPVFVCSTFLAEPERPDLLLLANQGVFRVTLKPV